MFRAPRIDLKNIARTNALAYFARMSVMKQNVFNLLRLTGEFVIYHDSSNSMVMVNVGLS